jgi:hypothetical protein
LLDTHALSGFVTPSTACSVSMCLHAV